MSFKSLVNKLMKEGKSKEAATKIAGKVASEKMKGAGSGPTAKQKARMKKSPAKKYDRVVLGGNKGDKSKTKPGKKDYESPAKMKKSPAKKPLVGKQKNLPEHLKKAILDAPAKMLSKSGMKMMKEGSPAQKKEKVKFVKTGKTIKEGPAAGFAEVKGSKDMPRKRAERKERKGKGFIAQKYEDSPAKMKAPVKKSKKKVEQDYARNAIADYKDGKTKEGNYEKKKALELAAGESGVMMKKSPSMMKTPMMKYDNSPALIKKAPTMMKTNQMGGGVAAKDSAAPAKQLKKLGSILSKHMKSN